MSQSRIILLNGNIIASATDKQRDEALAIQDGRVVAIGSNSDVQRFSHETTKVIDLEGKTVLPGLVDCHVHMTSVGHLLQRLDLRNTTSLKEIQQKLKDYVMANPDKGWILGGRWDQDKLMEERYPTRWDLDAAISDKPVFLTRVCGHLGVANSLALQLAGITEETTVESGKIDLDETTGKPNGILRENALELIRKKIPLPSSSELEKICLLACQEAVKFGLTGVHWITSSAQEIQALQKLQFEEKLPLRVYLGIPVSLLEELTRLGLLTGFGNNMLRIGFIKIFADGSFGARTASLKEPYSDKPKTKGMTLYPEEELSNLISKAHEAGLQAAVHAIGDQAIDAVIQAFEKALKKHPRKDARHRIEHCSLLNPELIRRLKHLGLVISVQPHFIISDSWIINRLGEQRTRWVHPFNSLVKEGLVVASGSDGPVEPINPLIGIYAAISRRDYPDENLTIQKAVETYTKNAAFASFNEKNKGILEPDKFADLTILSDDPFTIPHDKIPDIKVEMTIVGGKIVYTREKSS